MHHVGREQVATIPLVPYEESNSIYFRALLTYWVLCDDQRSQVDAHRELEDESHLALFQ
jgi:hypothetical protein